MKFLLFSLAFLCLFSSVFSFSPRVPKTLKAPNANGPTVEFPINSELGQPCLDYKRQRLFVPAFTLIYSFNPAETSPALQSFNTSLKNVTIYNNDACYFPIAGAFEGFMILQSGCELFVVDVDRGLVIKKLAKNACAGLTGDSQGNLYYTSIGLYSKANYVNRLNQTTGESSLFFNATTAGLLDVIDLHYDLSTNQLFGMGVDYQFGYVWNIDETMNFHVFYQIDQIYVPGKLAQDTKNNIHYATEISSGEGYALVFAANGTVSGGEFFNSAPSGIVVDSQSNVWVVLGSFQMQMAMKGK